MTATLEGVSDLQHIPAALYPRERPSTHCTGRWVGPRAGLNRQKSRTTRIRSLAVQPIGSRYTDRATRPTLQSELLIQNQDHVNKTNYC